jgi:hypothetical protein
MSNLRYSVFITLVLLVCVRTETRPLRPNIGRNLSLLLQASNQVAKEALGPNVEEGINKTPNEQPNRVSPGGPDPHHHFLYGRQA